MKNTFGRKTSQPLRNTQERIRWIVEDRNILQEKIAKATQQKNILSPLLLQIDDWQKKMIENVKQAANKLDSMLSEC